MNKINESGKVTLGQAWKDFWVGYFDFKGTSTRAGFWWGMLEYFLISLVWNIIRSNIQSYNEHVWLSIGLDKTIIFITEILNLILFIPYIAVITRRLRDVGVKNILITIMLVIYLALLFGARFATLSISANFACCEIILAIIFIILCCLPTKTLSKK